MEYIRGERPRDLSLGESAGSRPLELVGAAEGTRNQDPQRIGMSYPEKRSARKLQAVRLLIGPVHALHSDR